jgi:hypothetical protein
MKYILSAYSSDDAYWSSRLIITAFALAISIYGAILTFGLERKDFSNALFACALLFFAVFFKRTGGSSKRYIDECSITGLLAFLATVAFSSAQLFRIMLAN